MPNLTLDAGLFGKDAGDALDYTFANFGFADSGSGSIDDSYSTDLGFVSGSIYYELGMRYDLAFGLTGKAHLDLGGISGALDYTENPTTSTRASVDGTTAAFVDLSAATIDASDFAITPPSAEDSYISIDMYAKLKADLFGKLGYSVESWLGNDTGETSFDVNIVDIAIDENDIVKLTGADLAGADDELYAFDLGIGELHIGLPVMEFDDATAVDADDPLGALVSSATSEPFLTFEVDLDSFLLPAGNSFDYGEEFGPLSFGVDVGIIDAKVVASAALRQDVEWDPSVDVTLVTSLGETIEGALGDIFEFTTPEGEGKFTVTATYYPSITVSTTTSLVLATSLDWKIGYGEAGFGVDVDIWQDEYKVEFALIEGSAPLGEDISFELTTTADIYAFDPIVETYTVYYENFVTAASGALLRLTTHQLLLDAGDIDNVAIGNQLANTIDGQGGNDAIRAGAGDDRLHGGAGADVLAGDAGDDRLDGGDGNDTATYIRAAAAVTVDLAAGTATGEGADTLVSIERVRGSAFDDTLIGNGAAMLAGGAGSDRLVGGVTADGTHGDWVTYRASSAGVTVDLTTGVASGGEAAGDTLSGIARVIGSRHDDVLTGDGAANFLFGGPGGADTLRGGAGADRLSVSATPALLDGGRGVDTLLVSGGDLVLTDANFVSIEKIAISGPASVDLSGVSRGSEIRISNTDGAQAVKLVGTSGDDAISSHGKATIDGGAGDDILHAASGVYFAGGEGDDTLYLSGTGLVGARLDSVERVVLESEAQFDLRSYDTGLTIEAPGGTIYGTAGDDVIRMGALGGTVTGGRGDDRIELGRGAETIRIDSKLFGDDVVAGFDLAKDQLTFAGSGIETANSVYFTRADNGSLLHYEGYDRGVQVSGTILFEGLDYFAASQMTMVF